MQICKIHSSAVDHFLTDVDSGDVAENAGKHFSHSSYTASNLQGCEIQRRPAPTADTMHLGHDVIRNIDFAGTIEIPIFPLLGAVHDVVGRILSRTLVPIFPHPRQSTVVNQATSHRQLKSPPCCRRRSLSTRFFPKSSTSPIRA